jgi:hypothetical protein
MLRGPYRQSAESSSVDAPRLPDREEVVSYVLLAGAGGLPVAGALAHHAAFHTEATIGLFMVVAGVLGLASAVRAAWIAPRRS